MSKKRVLAGILSFALVGVLTSCGTDEADTAASTLETNDIVVTTVVTEEVAVTEATTAEEVTEAADVTEAEELNAITSSSDDLSSMLKISSEWILADKPVKEAVSAEEYGDVSNFDMSRFDDAKSMDGVMEMYALFMPVTADFKLTEDDSAKYLNIDMKMDLSAMAGMFGAMADGEDAGMSEIPDSINFNYSAKIDTITGDTILALPSVKQYAKMDAANAGIDLSSFNDMMPEGVTVLTVEEVDHDGSKMYRVSYNLPADAISGVTDGMDVSAGDLNFCGLSMSGENDDLMMYAWFDENYDIKAFCSAPMGMIQFIKIDTIGKDIDVASVFDIEGYIESTEDEMIEAIAAAQSIM